MDDLREARPGAIEIALAVPVREGRVLVARRPEGGHLAGRWEFPGGKVESGETAAATAQRELHEETGLVAGEVLPLVVVLYDYPDRSLRLSVFLAPDAEGEVRMNPPREWGWKTPAELESLQMPEANRPMLRALRWRLKG